MSTDLSYCSQTFQTDCKTLKTDAAQYNTDLKLEAEAKASVVKECEALANEYKGNPTELLAVLIVKVLGSRSSNAYQMELKVSADGVQVQGDITKLSNDIQNKVNAGGNTASNGVQEVAAETDVMQSILGTANSSSPSFAPDVQEALGTTASNLMSDNFANMRNDIYWSNDPNAALYNPPENPNAPTKASSYTYHFCVGSCTNSSDYMTSYNQMDENLKTQGDPKGAQEANKILVDNYNQNVSTTQSLGSAANAEIGLITSRIKMITSATSDFAQDILTGNRTAVKDQISQ